MVDYVDTAENYTVAGDYDSRKRYIQHRTGGSNPLAVCSGVTWRVGGGADLTGHPARAWRWLLGSRGYVTFEPGSLSATAPSPQNVTDCMI
jgi:hypothetical protein